MLSNRVYPFRLRGGKSKLISYILCCGKGKTNWPSVYVSRWLLHAVVTLGKCCSKLEIRTKLMLKALLCGQDAGSVSLSKATSPTFSSSIYFHGPPLFPELLMSNKGNQSKNNGMFLALQECHTPKDDVYPPQSQLSKRPSRQKEACDPGGAAEAREPGWVQLWAAPAAGPGSCLPAGCCPGVAQTHLTWGEAISISKPLLILVES